MSRYLVLALDRELLATGAIEAELFGGTLMIWSDDIVYPVCVKSVITVVSGEALERRLDAIVQGESEQTAA